MTGKLRFDFEGVNILKAKIKDEEDLEMCFSDLKHKLWGKKK